MSSTVDPFDPRNIPVAPPSSASSSTQCPKCSWHHPAGARSCASCGLIFAKFDEAERRRRARAMTAALAPEPINEVADRPHDARFAGDRWVPGSSASLGAGGPVVRPEVASPSALIGEAMQAASSSLVPLVLLQVVPWLLMMALAMGLGIAIAMAAKSAVAMAGLFVVLLLVMLRVAAAVTAGSMIVVDDCLRGGEHRGFVAAFGDGWARGSRTMGVIVAVALLTVLPGVIALGWSLGWDPATGLQTAMSTSTVPLRPLAALGAALAIGVFVGLRLSLALPAVVLGHQGVVEAIQESVSLTSEHSGVVMKTLGLFAVVGVLLSMFVGALSLIPLLGLLLALVGNAFIGGMGAGVVAALWRRLSGG